MLCRKCICRRVNRSDRSPLKLKSIKHADLEKAGKNRRFSPQRESLDRRFSFRISSLKLDLLPGGQELVSLCAKKKAAKPNPGVGDSPHGTCLIRRRLSSFRP